MDIDWSKAPKGATHCHAASGEWLKVKGIAVFVWRPSFQAWDVSPLKALDITESDEFCAREMTQTSLQAEIESLRKEVAHLNILNNEKWETICSLEEKLDAMREERNTLKIELGEALKLILQIHASYPSVQISGIVAQHEGDPMLSERAKFAATYKNFDAEECEKEFKVYWAEVQRNKPKGDKS